MQLKTEQQKKIAAFTFAHPDLEEDFLNAQQAQWNRLIDSTLLRPNCTAEEIKTLCFEAIQHNFRSVCIPPCFVDLAAQQTFQSNHTKLPTQITKICTVIGFPLGYTTANSKMYEAAQAIQNGANELDFVQNVTLVKEKSWENLKQETMSIVKAAKGNLVKVILETSLLTPEEISQCTMLHAQAGAHVIKTSTGFGTRGASPEDLVTIRSALECYATQTGIRLGIKASGGIRTQTDAQIMLNNGATRLGTSNGTAIVLNQAQKNPAERNTY